MTDNYCSIDFVRYYSSHFFYPQSGTKNERCFSVSQRDTKNTGCFSVSRGDTKNIICFFVLRADNNCIIFFVRKYRLFKTLNIFDNLPDINLRPFRKSTYLISGLTGKRFKFQLPVFKELKQNNALDKVVIFCL